MTLWISFVLHSDSMLVSCKIFSWSPGLQTSHEGFLAHSSLQKDPLGYLELLGNSKASAHSTDFLLD